jgi:hypothetical protein
MLPEIKRPNLYEQVIEHLPLYNQDGTTPAIPRISEDYNLAARRLSPSRVIWSVYATEIYHRHRDAAAGRRYAA